MSSLAAWLAQWLGSPQVKTPAPTPQALPVASLAAEPDYPVRARGLPAIGVSELLAPHADWLQRLRDAYGADRPTFDRDIRGVVERYAQSVHLLPATPDVHFHHAGGLLRMGLEVGFYALQASDAALFAVRERLTARATAERRWRHATFLAGLCSELHRTLAQWAVTNDEGETWPAYLQPLAHWLQATQSRRYHLRWLATRTDSGALGIVTLAHIVTPAILQSLAQDNTVVGALMAVVSGREDGASTLARLVQRSSALVIEHERRADAARGDAPAAGPCPRAPAAQLAAARLHPAVRAALGEIIAALDQTAMPLGAAGSASGWFIPLREFEQRRVDPALAVRALSDAGMLASDPDHAKSRTRLRTCGKEAVLGIVLAPESVALCDAPLRGAIATDR